MSKKSTQNPFIINKYLKVQLEGNKANIYVNNQIFSVCYKILTQNFYSEINFDENSNIINTIEKFITYYPEDYLEEFLEDLYYEIKDVTTPIDLFWAICSILQAWYEHDYNMDIISNTFALPLLKKLAEEGDIKAQVRLEQFSQNDFVVNQYLHVQLQGYKIQIYVNDLPYNQCYEIIAQHQLKSAYNNGDFNFFDELEFEIEADKSIAIEAQEFFIEKNQDFNFNDYINTFFIQLKDKFWAICSVLQAWYEHDYNMDIISNKFALPLLKLLAQVGDPKAQKKINEIHKKIPTFKKIIITQPKLRKIRTNFRIIILLAVNNKLNYLNLLKQLYHDKKVLTPSQQKRFVSLKQQYSQLALAKTSSILTCDGSKCDLHDDLQHGRHLLDFNVIYNPWEQKWQCTNCFEGEYLGMTYKDFAYLNFNDDPYRDPEDFPWTKQFKPFFPITKDSFTLSKYKTNKLKENKF